MYLVSYPSGITLQVWGQFATVEHKGRQRPSIKVDNSDVTYLIAPQSVVRSQTAILYEPPKPAPVKQPTKQEFF